MDHPNLSQEQTSKLGEEQSKTRKILDDVCFDFENIDVSPSSKTDSFHILSSNNTTNFHSPSLKGYNNLKSRNHSVQNIAPQQYKTREISFRSDDPVKNLTTNLDVTNDIENDGQHSNSKQCNTEMQAEIVKEQISSNQNQKSQLKFKKIPGDVQSKKGEVEYFSCVTKTNSSSSKDKSLKSSSKFSISSMFSRRSIPRACKKPDAEYPLMSNTINVEKFDKSEALIQKEDAGSCQSDVNMDSDTEVYSFDENNDNYSLKSVPMESDVAQCSEDHGWHHSSLDATVSFKKICETLSPDQNIDLSPSKNFTSPIPEIQENLHPTSTNSGNLMEQVSFLGKKHNLVEQITVSSMEFVDDSLITSEHQFGSRSMSNDFSNENCATELDHVSTQTPVEALDEDNYVDGSDQNVNRYCLNCYADSGSYYVPHCARCKFSETMTTESHTSAVDFDKKSNSNFFTRKIISKEPTENEDWPLEESNSSLTYGIKKYKVYDVKSFDQRKTKQFKKWYGRLSKEELPLGKKSDSLTSESFTVEKVGGRSRSACGTMVKLHHTIASTVKETPKSEGAVASLKSIVIFSLKEYLKNILSCHLWNSHNAEACYLCDSPDEASFTFANKDNFILQNNEADDKSDQYLVSLDVICLLIDHVSEVLDYEEKASLFKNQGSSEASLYHINVILKHVAFICSLLKRFVTSYPPLILEELIEDLIVFNLINSYIMSKKCFRSQKKKKRGRPLNMEKYLSEILNLDRVEVSSHLVSKVLSYLESEAFSFEYEVVVFKQIPIINRFSRTREVPSVTENVSIIDRPTKPFHGMKKKLRRSPKNRTSQSLKLSQNPAWKTRKRRISHGKKVKLSITCTKDPYDFQSSDNTDTDITQCISARLPISSRNSELKKSLHTHSGKFCRSGRNRKPKVTQDTGYLDSKKRKRSRSAESQPSANKRCGQFKKLCVSNISSPNPCSTSMEENREEVPMKIKSSDRIRNYSLRDSSAIKDPSVDDEELMSANDGHGSTEETEIELPLPSTSKGKSKARTECKSIRASFLKRNLERVKRQLLKPFRSKNKQGIHKKSFSIRRMSLLKFKRAMVIECKEVPKRHKHRKNGSEKEVDGIEEVHSCDLKPPQKRGGRYATRKKDKRNEGCKPSPVASEFGEQVLFVPKSGKETIEEDAFINRPLEDSAFDELQKYKEYYTGNYISREAAPPELLRAWSKELNKWQKVTCNREGCGKTFGSKRAIVYHYEQAACLQSQQTWKCNVCEKRLRPFPKIMLNHLKRHYVFKDSCDSLPMVLDPDDSQSRVDDYPLGNDAQNKSSLFEPKASPTTSRQHAVKKSRKPIVEFEEELDVKMESSEQVESFENCEEAGKDDLLHTDLISDPSLVEELEKYKEYYTSHQVSLRQATSAQIKAWMKQLNTEHKIVCPREGCGRVLESKGGIIHHYERVCLKPKMWQCKICERFFKPSGKRMLNHLKKIHLIHEKSVSLPIMHKERCARLQYSNANLFPKLQHEHLMPELKCLKSMWKLLDPSDYDHYLPPLKQSAKFKVQNLSEVEDSMWSSLGCFESSDINENSRQALFFVGSSIASVAWCPTSLTKRDCNQFLAIATNTDSATSHTAYSTESRNCVLQFWGFGPLNNTSLVNKPELKLSAALNCGTIWDMAWCPSGCWEDPDNVNPAGSKCANIIPRLGLLAVSFSDSNIRIYSIPHPENLNYPSEGLIPLYLVHPVLVLRALYSGPAKICQKSMCTALSWQRTDKSELIAGGFANGLISLWQIKNDGSNVLCADTKCLLPFLTFFGHMASIKAVQFAPVSGGRWLASCGVDRYVKVWDLDDTSIPVQSVKKDCGRRLQWPPFWTGVFSCNSDSYDFDAGAKYLDCIGSKPCCVTVFNYSGEAQAFSLSERLNVIALGDSSGLLSMATVHNIPRKRSSPPMYYYPIFQTEIKDFEELSDDIPNRSSCLSSKVDQVKQHNTRNSRKNVSCCSPLPSDVVIQNALTDDLEPNNLKSVKHSYGAININQSPINVTSNSQLASENENLAPPISAINSANVPILEVPHCESDVLKSECDNIHVWKSSNILDNTSLNNIPELSSDLYTSDKNIPELYGGFCSSDKNIPELYGGFCTSDKNIPELSNDLCTSNKNITKISVSSGASDIFELFDGSDSSDAILNMPSISPNSSTPTYDSAIYSDGTVSKDSCDTEFQKCDTNSAKNSFSEIGADPNHSRGSPFDSSKFEPGSYNNVPNIHDWGERDLQLQSRRYGLVYTDVGLGKLDEVPKRLIEKVKSNGIIEHYCYNHFASVNSVAWNPNPGSHFWLFSAGQCGIARILCISGLFTK